MQIEYRLSLKDYQEASQAHLKLNEINSLSPILILSGLLLLLRSLIGKTKFDESIIYIVLGGLGLLLGIFFHPYVFNRIMNYSIKNAWEKSSNIHPPMSIEVNKGVIIIKSINFESSSQWQLFIQAVETKNLFILYQANVLFKVIPKRAFNSDEQVEEFRELLRAKIAKFIQA